MTARTPAPPDVDEAFELWLYLRRLELAPFVVSHLRGVA